MVLPPHAPEPPEVLDRVAGPLGETVLRRRAAGHFEIISNGCFLMDTSDGHSERLLVRSALTALPACRQNGARVLIGGLGVGFSLAEAAGDPRVHTVTVVERDPAILAWHAPGGPLAAFSGVDKQTPGAADPESGVPRVRFLQADLLEHLDELAHRSWRARDPRWGSEPLQEHEAQRYDALCLDIDNGPDWTVTDGNAGLYGSESLRLLRCCLTPAGVLTLWSAAPSAAFEERLRQHFSAVSVHRVPSNVPRAEPDVVYQAAR